MTHGIVLTLALLTAGAALATLWSTLRFRRRSVRVEGRVVGRTAYRVQGWTDRGWNPTPAAAPAPEAPADPVWDL